MTLCYNDHIILIRKYTCGCVTKAVLQEQGIITHLLANILGILLAFLYRVQSLKREYTVLIDRVNLSLFVKEKTYKIDIINKVSRLHYFRYNP